MTKCMTMECSMRRRTLREATYCQYVIINMIITVLMLNERNVSVQIFLQFVLAIHDLFPLLEGRHLAYQVSSDEAHGAVYSVSGPLRHHGSGVLAKLRRKCWVLTMYQSQRSRTHWDRTPSRATNSV